METLEKKRVPMSFAEEYEKFVLEYLCPLLGITEGSYTLERLHGESCSRTIMYTDDIPLTFSAGTTSYFRLRGPIVTDENIRLARNVVDAFLAVSEYSYRKGQGRGQAKFYSGTHRDNVYRKAVERGIHCWIVDYSQKESVDKFFDILDTWSVKTYEGKSVTFGFVLQPHRRGRKEKLDTDNYEDETISAAGKITADEWLNFLKEDTSAVLTDCIHSIIELDEDCNFERYCSIAEEQTIPSRDLDYRIPIRFTHVIKKYVTDKKVGVFLLGNGDIVLAKNQAVYFVKRNRQWLNLSYEAFRKALIEFLPVADHGDMIAQQKERLLEEIFASVLDVSFSHAGGIIAIANEHSVEINQKVEPLSNVVGAFDDLMNDAADYESVNVNSKRPADKEKYQKIVKRKMIKNLVGEHTFCDLDRKLRCELIGLDGACILSEDGKIRSFGAIIKNDPGSTGGARKAAAEKLSKYGMAVKISTDGYIEVFIDGVCKYTIK